MKIVPLKHLVRFNDRALRDDTDPSYEFRYLEIGAVGRGRLMEQPAVLSFAEAPSRARRVVRDGDTIISTVRTYLRAVWPVNGAGDNLVVSTGFSVLTPGADVDSRYLSWLSQSDLVVEEIVARSVGVSYPAINPTDIGSIRVPIPALHVQRAIADYLDAETTRIDALIEKKQRMVELLEERRRRHISVLLWSGAYRRTRLKNLVGRPTSGNRDHSRFSLTNEGVPCLRGLNVRQGGIDKANLQFIAHGEHRRHVASELHAGDVVVVRSGLAGAAAVVPEDLDGCNCVDLVIIRQTDRLDSKYLAYVLNSDEAKEQIRLRTSGALLMHLNADQCGELVIPYPPRTEQRRLMTELDGDGGRLGCLVNVLEQQVGNLAERRQSLITAAVTGVLPIPGVAA